MKKVLTLLIVFSLLSEISAQKISYGTITSSFMSNTNSSYTLVSSIGEAAPINEYNIGTLRLTQGFFQYELKKATQIQNILQSDFAVYPNPTSGLINVSLNNIKASELDIQIENLLGQIVYSQSYKLTNHRDVIQCDISYLPNSSYILKIVDRKENTICPVKINKY